MRKVAGEYLDMFRARVQPSLLQELVNKPYYYTLGDMVLQLYVLTFMLSIGADMSALSCSR